MQKFIIPQPGSIPSRTSIQGQDAKHIFRVLRLKPGKRLIVTDGTGTDYSACITAVSTDRTDLDILEPIKPHTESFADITLCCGMLKDKKMDFVIRHVTQLGIYQWIPFFCERSIPSPDPKRMHKRIQRWRTIARESLKQCNRSLVPAIAGPMHFRELLEHSSKYDLKIAFWEDADMKPTPLKRTSRPGRIMILIGPEGGFSEQEMKMAEKRNFMALSLGPRILRAETAAVSACTLAQHIFGDM